MVVFAKELIVHFDEIESLVGLGYPLFVLLDKARCSFEFFLNPRFSLILILFKNFLFANWGVSTRRVHLQFVLVECHDVIVLIPFVFLQEGLVVEVPRFRSDRLGVRTRPHHFASRLLVHPFVTIRGITVHFVCELSEMFVALERLELC